jgi:hypothetical protein
MKPFVAIAFLVFLIVSWRAGTYDKALYPLHLNVKPCGYVLAVLYCGDDYKKAQSQAFLPTIGQQ